MSRRVLCAWIIVAVVVSGCASNVVKNIHSPKDVTERPDGAVIGYYLPKSIWTFTASYDPSTGLLSLTADASPTVVPDTSTKMLLLSYAHAGLSDDDFDVFLDGLTLKSVATKTSDQSVKVIEAVNTLLTEAGTAQTTLQKSLIAKAATEVGVTPQGLKNAGCTTTLKSEITANLSSQTKGSQNDLLWGENCSLQIIVYMDVVSRIAPFGSSQDLPMTEALTANEICNRAVCFRPSKIVRTRVSVTLLSNLVHEDGTPIDLKSEHPGKSYPVVLPYPGNPNNPKPMTKAFKLTQTFKPVTVPSARGLAFVEFSRRAFVENHTTIAFANGVLSEFHSTDPSIATGAITIGSDVLKSVVLTVPLVR